MALFMFMFRLRSRMHEYDRGTLVFDRRCRSGHESCLTRLQLSGLFFQSFENCTCLVTLHDT